MTRRQLRRLPPLLGLASNLVFLFYLYPGAGLWWPSVTSGRLPALMLTPPAAVAASPATPAGSDLPAHAIPRFGGQRWACERGYRREGQRCVRIQVPPHAFLDYFGNDWECERGYRREGARCIDVQVPPHAFLDSSGHDWQCERGYRRGRGDCVPVQVPAHAYLDIIGHDWKCTRGYRREEKRCVEVHIPPHAFLNYLGHDWECEHGYRRDRVRCVPVQVPAHAMLDFTGHSWRCQDGYQQIGKTCKPLPGETTTMATSSEDEFAQLATSVYASKGAPHDRQTIVHLQRQLQQATYNPGPIDGLLGPRTLAALQQFLTDRGLISETVSHATTPPTPGS